MPEAEGVIQFTLDHTVTEPFDYPVIEEPALCHGELHKLGLISQDDLLYHGYAFGNMSARLGESSFVISGTQTGAKSILNANDYCLVESCDPENNRVISQGPIHPSSECMTHASIYSADPHALAVVHVHSAEIWNNYQQLGLSFTSPDIEYGTPAMANAVTLCISEMSDLESGCIAMLGHEDGVICFAESVQAATELTLALFRQVTGN